MGTGGTGASRSRRACGCGSERRPWAPGQGLGPRSPPSGPCTPPPALHAGSGRWAPRAPAAAPRRLPGPGFAGSRGPGLQAASLGPLAAAGPRCLGTSSPPSQPAGWTQPVRPPGCSPCDVFSFGFSSETTSNLKTAQRGSVPCSAPSCAGVGVSAPRPSVTVQGRQGPPAVGPGGCPLRRPAARTPHLGRDGRRPAPRESWGTRAGPHRATSPVTALACVGAAHVFTGAFWPPATDDTEHVFQVKIACSRHDPAGRGRRERESLELAAPRDSGFLPAPPGRGPGRCGQLWGAVWPGPGAGEAEAAASAGTERGFSLRTCSLRLWRCQGLGRACRRPACWGGLWAGARGRRFPPVLHAVSSPAGSRSRSERLAGWGMVGGGGGDSS